MNQKLKTLKTLKQWDVQARLLNKQETNSYIRKWKKSFLVPITKKIDSSSTFSDFCYTFWFNLTPCLKDKSALKAYKKEKETSWDILFWDGYPERVMACVGKLLPTPRQLEKLRQDQESFADIHLTNADFKWTFCITHEEECGPYFSKPPKGWRSKLTIPFIRRKLRSKIITPKIKEGSNARSSR